MPGFYISGYSSIDHGGLFGKKLGKTETNTVPTGRLGISFYNYLPWIHASYRMAIHKVLRLSQRRSIISSLFGLTFIATCLTVSASNILPCPVRPERGRFSDSNNETVSMKDGLVKVVRRPRRWIEEKAP